MNRPHWYPAFVGIGSNLESPSDQISSAITHLRALPDSSVVSESGHYRSAPMGPQDQPDFLNVVVAVLTALSAIKLLHLLHEIEVQHGRDRSGDRWGPRTLDLDLLAYSNHRVDSDELTLPHPGIAERNFVLLPWSEIAPQYTVPGLGSVADLASRVSCNQPAIEKISQENPGGRQIVI